MERLTLPRRDAGFTLLEVLVALGIIATTLGMLIVIAADGLRHSSHWRNSLVAQWVADNKAAELMLQSTNLATGTQTGTVAMARREWTWQIQIDKTPDPHVFRLNITINLAGAPKEQLAKLHAFALRIPARAPLPAR